MRKKILGGIAVLAIAAVVAINVNLNTNNNDLSDLSLANVEALASSESGEWYAGYKTGDHTINGTTVSCCIQGETTDACNYGVVGCIHINF